MNELNQQQNDTETQQNQNTGQRRGLAIASLVMGILSILLLITIVFPFVLGILAIIFGALSLKRKKSGMAISGIVTGAIGIFLAVTIIIVGVGSFLLVKNEPSDSISVSENIESPPVEEQFSLMETFYGDGFELTYSGALWTPLTMEGVNGGAPALQYVLDKTVLMPTGVSGMLGHSLATSSGRDEMYKAFYDSFEISMSTVNTYISSGTETFEVLKDDLYYASYCFYGNDDKELVAKIYVIASERDDIVMSFSARLGPIAKSGPDIPIMPILESIVISDMPVVDTEPYEQKVWESDEEYTVGNDSIPSLSKIMNDKNISYEYINGEKTIGAMTIPSILNYYKSPELVSVEIIEVTYENVDDVWGAIDAYGRLLNESHDFRVTYTPTDYPNYGGDYRFCELIKESDNDEAGIIYVAAVYSQDEGVVKMQFGTMGTPSIPIDGIGPLNLEAIGAAGSNGS